MHSLLPGLLFTLMAGCSYISLSELEQLEAQGNPIVQQIEDYSAKHGVYPPELAAAGIELPDADFGGWVYWVSDDGHTFQLAIGDYGTHLFTLFWHSELGAWYRDT